MSNFISIFKYFNFLEIYDKDIFIVKYAKNIDLTTTTTMYCSHFCSQVLKPFFLFPKQKRRLTTKKGIWDYICAHEAILQNIVVRVYGMIREIVEYTLKPDYKHDYKLTIITTWRRGDTR